MKRCPALAALLLATGCGGGDAVSTADVIATIALDPPQATLTLAEPIAFRASAAGVVDPQFVWTVTGGSIVASAGATMSYRAPDAPGTAQVSVSTAQAPTVSAVASVTVVRPLGVTVDVVPAGLVVYPLQRGDFSANVRGSFLADVEWSADGGQLVAGSGGATGWVAPLAPGTYRIVATARADPAASGAAIVQVASPPLVIWLTPSSAQIAAGAAVTITAGISTNEAPGVDTSITWRASGGSLVVDAGGVARFAADQPGTYTIEARSVTYPSVAASSVVVVQ